MRNRCTLIPVKPTMSARSQRSQSIGSTFSSIERDGMLARRECRQERQAGHRQVGPFAEERQAHTPFPSTKPRNED